MSREPLSHVDAAWFRLEEPDNPVDITVLLELEGEADFGRLSRAVEERLLTFRRFRQRIVESPGRVAAPEWEDDPDFALDRHLHRMHLGGRRLEDVVSERTSHPLPMDRPLWQLDVIDGAPGGTALLARLHHCIGDGFALIRVLLTVADEELAPPPTGEEHEPAHASLRERVAHEVGELAHHPSHAAELAHDARSTASALGHLLLLPFDRPNPLRGRVIGRRRVAWSSAIPLDGVKALGRAMGATVNDVLLGAMTGALRRYLQSAGDPATEPVRAVVPVNLRSVRRIEEMEPVLGNRFGLVFLDLPVHADDARRRLVLLKEGMDRLKESAEAVVAFGILAGMGAAPGVVEHVVAEVFRRKASLVATNVPGPTRALSFAGRPVRDVMFWVPHPAKFAVGISILSYAGRVRVGVRTDTAVVADPSSITRAFEEELAAMSEQTSAQVAP